MRQSPAFYVMLTFGSLGAFLVALYMAVPPPRPVPQPVPATWTAKEEPRVVPLDPLATIDLVYAEDSLVRLRQQFRGTKLADRELVRALTPFFAPPTEADNAETVAVCVGGEKKPDGFRVHYVRVKIVTFDSAPRPHAERLLATGDADFDAVRTVLKPHIDAAAAPQTDVPQKVVTCNCAYCGCCSRRPRDCGCNEEKCKAAKCECGKWKKPDPKEVPK